MTVIAAIVFAIVVALIFQTVGIMRIFENSDGGEGLIPVLLVWTMLALGLFLLLGGAVH